MGFTQQHAEALAARLRSQGPERREARRHHIQQLLTEATQLLTVRFGATRVWQIGSLDAPWFNEESDVDLVVQGVAPEHAGRAEEALVALFESRVDLLLIEELDPSFRLEVETEGRVLR